MSDFRPFLAGQNRILIAQMCLKPPGYWLKLLLVVQYMEIHSFAGLTFAVFLW
jgi:hypothetical protein